MTYKILGAAVLALVVLVLVALEVRTTGSYEHTFNASEDKVWRMWSDADLIKHWWGPTDYSAPFIRNDLRAGGTYLWAMKSPKGEMFWNTGVYNEVVPNRRIVSALSFADETGKAVPGSKAPVPGRWPNAVTVIVEFSESSGKTKVIVTEVGLPLIVMILSRVSWDQQFEKIEGLLAGTTGLLFKPLPAPSTPYRGQFLRYAEPRLFPIGAFTQAYPSQTSAGGSFPLPGLEPFKIKLRPSR